MTTPIRDMTGPQLRRFFDALARATAARLPPGTFFTLLVFDETKVGQYVSNADRASMIKVMRETADRLEAREDVTR